MIPALEARRRAQELVDSILNGKSVEIETPGGKFIVPTPRWIRRIKVVHHSPEEFKVDSTVPSREAAIDVIAASSWARNWAAGLLRAFWPEFETLPPEVREKHIRDWSHKLAERVVREYVPLGS